MIRLSIPSSDQKYYLLMDSFLFGPYGANGSWPREIVEFRSSQDSISDSKSMKLLGIDGDNPVTHAEMSGEVDYLPHIALIKTLPSPQYPDRFTMKLRNASSGTIADQAVLYGRALTRRVNLEVTGSSAIHRWWTGDATNAILWQLSFNLLAPNKISQLQKKGRYNIRLAGNVFQRDEEFGALTSLNNKIVSFDGTKPLSYDFCVSLTEGVQASVPSKTTLGTTAQIADTTPTVSPPYLMALMDSFLENVQPVINSPLKGIPEGDLAMKAAAKVNRNPVNMIAFLRDLRDPKALIPKLKNLGKFKTHAGNYLGMQYGILPTIDDLQHIAQAVKKINPHITKGGYSSYSASYEEFAFDGYTEHQLTQRIKLAIEDEDDQFQRLLSSIESSGFAPTFENLYDLIPYSFVLDWFVDVGGFLERVDSRLRLSRLNIVYVTTSYKHRSTFKLQSETKFPFAGTIESVRYHRRVSDRCPVPALSAHTTFLLPNHWLEASALIVSRQKH